MITVEKVDHHTLDYTCSCGVNGECMFKPPEGNSLMLIEIRCPMCGATETVKIMKYDSEDSREELSIDDAELHWTIIMDNRVKEE